MVKPISDYTVGELSAKIEAIKTERERTENALKRYEEELERRKQEVPLGVPAVGKFCLTYDGHVTKFLNNKQKPEDYNFNIFPSEESAEKHSKMLLAWRMALVAISKGEPIDIEVLLPLMKKGKVAFCPMLRNWFWTNKTPKLSKGFWEIHGDQTWINGFNIKPADNWETSLMECGI